MQSPCFFDDLAEHGDRVAAVDDCGASITYRQLAAQADAMGAALPGNRVLALLEASNTVDWLVAYVSLLRGRIPFLLIPSGNKELLRQFTAVFEPKLLLLQADGYKPAASAMSTHHAVHDNLALLLSTSGTTGSVKCVKLSYGNIGSNADSIRQYLQINGQERGAVNLPVSYSYGLSIVNSHLAAGATLLLTSRSILEKEFWDFLRNQQATSFAGVPYSYELLEKIDLSSEAPSSLRYFTQAGGRLPAHLGQKYADLAQANGWRFFIMYGQTEATARIAYLPPELASTHAHCIGCPIPGGELSLLDEDDQSISGPNKPGELVYTGPNVMMGYAEEAAHLGLEPEGHMLRTGDLAQREEGGLYRIVGRKSRFIKLFGLRVGLDDVERLLENNGIAAAATGNDEALLVATTGKGQADRIVDLICGRLKLPRNCVKVAELNDYPLLSSGKIDYRELQLLLQEGMSEETAVFAPQQISGDLSPKEREIAAIWQEVLGVSAISADDTFFNLGGDSLSAITVMLKMEKAGIPEEVSRQIFDGCTIAEIADQGDKAGRPRIRSVESMTSNAINFTRGLLVLIVIGAHWGPFLLERLGTFGEMFTAWTWPIFRFGTPGFAMVFGLGLGYFWSPLVDSNRTRLANRVKTSLAVVCSGLAVIVVFRLLKWALGGAAPDVDWPTFVFYDVLLFYVFAVATVYPILLVCRKAEFPPMAAIAIALTSLAVSQAFAPLLESTATGFTKLGAIMLASNYSYPLMLSYTMIGMAAGLWIQINNHRPLLARMAAWGGGTLFFAGILLSIASGLTERWFVGTPHLNAIVSYSGVLLLAFAAAFAWEQYRTGATGLVFRVLAVLGILALPAYVIHAAAIPLKQILELLGAPIILAVGVAVLLTAALLGLAVYRVYSIYFGNLVRNRRETGAEHVAASVSEG